MYRPRHPQVMNNIHQNNTPWNSQWRPNHRPRAPPPFQWRNNGPENFGALVTEPGNREEHWCETCDRGFPTLDLLDKHKQQHQKCNIDGCQLVAHPKVITRHIQMQHSTGLYKKISKLENPEEILKWREERKRRYPTKSNIEKKAAECKEKIERGEKMALRNENSNQHKSAGTHGVKRKHSFDKGNQRQNRQNRPNFKQNQTATKETKAHPPPKKVPKTLPIAEQKSKLKPFTGIMNIEMDEKDEDCIETLESNHLIEDDDYEALKPEDNSANQKTEICSALTSLICDYGSSDDETDETKENKVTNDMVNITNQSTVVQKNYNRIVNLPKNHINLINESELNKSNKAINTVENKNISKQSTEEQKIDNTDNNLIESHVGPADLNVLNKSDDDSGPEETKIDKKNEIEIQCTQDKSAECNNGQKKTVSSTNKQKNNIRSANRQPNYKSKHKIPSTLLQKLLSKEIRHERNIVLQCIRYIKKNNYFDKTILG